MRGLAFIMTGICFILITSSCKEEKKTIILESCANTSIKNCNSNEGCMILSAQRYDPLKRCGLPEEPVACVELSDDSCQGKHFPNIFATDPTGTEWILLSACIPKDWKEFYPSISDSTPEPLLDESENPCANVPFSECIQDNGCVRVADYRYDVANRCRFLPEQAVCLPHPEELLCSGGPTGLEDSNGVKWIIESCSPIPEGWEKTLGDSGSPDYEAALGPLCLCEK